MPYRLPVFLFKAFRKALNMASVLKDGNGWRIRFYDGSGERKQIRLSGINKATAEQIGRHVEVLNSAKTANNLAIDRQTTLWLAKIGPKIYAKLASVGLVEPRESSSLGMFLKHYIQQRSDVKVATTRRLQSVTNHLIDHFGESVMLQNIHAGHADDFRSYLYGKGHAENTVRRYCGIAKQFFRAAIRRKLIEANPFADHVTTVKGNAAKFHFVTKSDAQKILDACPDLQWRMIFALCRFGGMRCPTEVLALRWQDINWEHGQFLVHSPKTEHHEGKETRLVPLFPELMEILSEGFREAEDGSTFVITRYRESTQNLRTTFKKIIKRAGLIPWPKPFQNLRSTRETELAEVFPLQAVTSWIGNSQLVASKHYLQLTDEHFNRASAKAAHPTTKLEGPAPQAAPKTSEMAETAKPLKAKDPRNTHVFRGSSADFVSIDSTIMGRGGIEPPTPGFSVLCSTN
jgi:integrase